MCLRWAPWLPIGRNEDFGTSRFLGSSSDNSVLPTSNGRAGDESNRSHPLLYRDAVWRTWSIATVLDRLWRSES